MSDAQRTSARPWYCSARQVDEYRETLAADESDLSMIKTLKIARSLLVNIGIIAIGGYGIAAGGDPTLIATLALAVLGGYNGLELSDYAALVQAYKEVQTNDE
jgi:hypothetical protein